MANKGKVVGKKAASDGKPSDSRAGKRRDRNKRVGARVPELGYYLIVTDTEETERNYFEGLREDFEGAYYGMYFLELMDYYTRENNDEREMLGLLYQSLRALLHTGLSNRLVRYIFEMKAMVLNGEFPGIPTGKTWDRSTEYAVDYIVHSGIEKLYTFTVTPEVLAQLREIADDYRMRYLDRTFKSLEIVDNL